MSLRRVLYNAIAAGASSIDDLERYGDRETVQDAVRKLVARGCVIRDRGTLTAVADAFADGRGRNLNSRACLKLGPAAARTLPYPERWQKTELERCWPIGEIR